MARTPKRAAGTGESRPRRPAGPPTLDELFGNPSTEPRPPILWAAENIRARTAQMRDLVAGANAPPQDKQAQDIADLIGEGDNFQCQKANVRNLMELVLGRPLPSAVDRSKFVVGALVQAWGKVLLVRSLDSDGDARFYTAAGSSDYRDHNYVTRSTRFAVATEAQVEEFLREAGAIQ
jgi:hypothetical protein